MGITLAAALFGLGLTPRWQARALPVTGAIVQVVPGGQSIGVLVKSAGVRVVAEAALRDSSGKLRRPAADAGVRAGDVIAAVNGQSVTNKETTARLIDDDAQAGRDVTLTIIRGGSKFAAQVHPVWDARVGRYLIGLWIEDGASGIGTLSFYDPPSRVFGALGHVVADPSNGEPFPVRTGSILPTVVSGVDRAEDGQTGEKIAVLMRPKSPLGTFRDNTDVGIFGHLAALPTGNATPVTVALPGDVHVGPARLLTVLSGQKVESFAISIEAVRLQSAPQPKGLVIRVTDPRLISEAGGIVQGMSGSPVIQDGRMVAVVTHVFVNDPTRGYAVYAYWMAVAAGLVPPSDATEAPGS